MFPHPIQPWRGLATLEKPEVFAQGSTHRALGSPEAGKTDVVLRITGLQKGSEEAVTATS